MLRLGFDHYPEVHYLIFKFSNWHIRKLAPFLHSFILNSFIDSPSLPLSNSLGLSLSRSLPLLVSPSQLLRPLGQILKHLINQLTLWCDDGPGGEEDEHQIGIRREIILIPEFKFPFVG